MMRLLVGWFVIALATMEARSASNRVGPCPRIPLDSCECFQRLYDTSMEIGNMSDIVARNWRITLMYQDISHSFQKLMHVAPDSTPGFPSIGVWPSIGAWASHAVGFSIRQQSLPELWSYMIRDLPHWMQDVLNKVPFGLVDRLFKVILQQAATALAEGNIFVFREIALAYVRYGLEFCGDKTKPNDTKMAQFVQKYVCTDGECDLAKGLWALYKAHYGAAESLTFSERDQLLLVQGMYVGLAEQTHLQPFINESLPGYTTNWCWLWSIGDATKCHEFINTLVTRILIHIFIGSHRLLADKNVPSGIHNGSDFSSFLTTLTLPQAHDLMLTMLNATMLQLNNTAATDWNILAQRMRFVAPLFWIFQDHEDINCYPFSAEQEFLIRTNQSDKLDPHSWLQICDKDCCADNGRWDGENK